ncbi:unnamed protein product [Arctogadus glacialis]
MRCLWLNVEKAGKRGEGRRWNSGCDHEGWLTFPWRRGIKRQASEERFCPFDRLSRTFPILVFPRTFKDARCRSPGRVLIGDLCADKFVIQLGDEDCILPSKLQAALQQVLEERELILGQEAEQEGAINLGYILHTFTIKYSFCT